ncbi:DPOD4 polymerase, partial [Polypterus senegalus]
MAPKKRLITDTFKVVKKAKIEEVKEGKVVKPDPEQEPELVPVPQRQLDLDLLKQFDLNWEFGPCLGITRLERWERADELGLNPPLQVYDLLQHHLEDPKYLNRNQLKFVRKTSVIDDRGPCPTGIPGEGKDWEGAVSSAGCKRAALLDCVVATEPGSSTLWGAVTTARGCLDGSKAMDFHTRKCCWNRNQVHKEFFWVPMQQFRLTRKCCRKVIREHIRRARVGRQMKEIVGEECRWQKKRKR